MHVDSDVHRSDIATHSLLGGQHGEESEESEEGQEGEEEEGEEVTFLLNDAFDSLMSKAASQRPARPKADQRNAAPSGHAGPGRRRRASAKPRFILHGTGCRVRPHGWTSPGVGVRACRRASPIQERSAGRSRFFADALGLESASSEQHPRPRTQSPRAVVRGLCSFVRRRQAASALQARAHEFVVGLLAAHLLGLLLLAPFGGAVLHLLLLRGQFLLRRLRFVAVLAPPLDACRRTATAGDDAVPKRACAMDVLLMRATMDRCASLVAG